MVHFEDRVHVELRLTEMISDISIQKNIYPVKKISDGTINTQSDDGDLSL